MPVLRYRETLELGGVAGLLAPLVGKAPPELRYWLMAGGIPAFLRIEGAMFLNGPVWRLEQKAAARPVGGWGFIRQCEELEAGRMIGARY